MNYIRYILRKLFQIYRYFNLPSIYNCRVVMVVDTSVTQSPSIKGVTKHNVISYNAHYRAGQTSGWRFYHATTTNFEKTLIPQYSFVHLNA
jgi:hypothetical protein